MRKCYLLTMPHMVLLDFAGPWQALHYANRQNARIEIIPVGPEPNVDLFDGLSLAGVQSLPPKIPEDAIVMVIGTHGDGAQLKHPASRTSIEWLRTHVRTSHTLVTVCAGSLAAAEAGLLKNRRCTTHHSLCERLALIEPSAQVCDDRIFVQDGHCYTSAGITAGLDLVLHLIGEWWDYAVALHVAREMVVYLRRSGDDPQLSPWLSWRNHMQAKVHRIQDHICRHPEERRNLEEMAHRVHLSVRHFTRQFREATGVSVHEYQQHIRLNHARRLLEETPHSIERVAELSGYGSARSLRRAWSSVHSAPMKNLRS